MGKRGCGDMKKLNTLYWLKQEKIQIENQIKELTVLSAEAMSGMPSGSTVSSPVERFNERLEKLKEKLQRKCAEILNETERIEEYIENIEDAEVRVIARKRFIENKTFQAIGDEMFIEKTTAYKKLKRYFERTE
jgi:molecular chaperone GrpE (heat shock protein)